MSDSTTVALVILGGVFVVMSITILKAGVDAAIKLWSVMGALTGIAFGSITTFYFADRSYQQEIRQEKGDKVALGTALNTAKQRAEEANKELADLASAVVSAKKSISSRSVAGKGITSLRPEFNNQLLAVKLKAASEQLTEIIKLPTSVIGVERKK